MTQRHRVQLAALSALVLVEAFALLGAPRTALATHPGGNGLIAYTKMIAPPFPNPPPDNRRAVFLYPGGQLTNPQVRPLGATGSYLENDEAPAWSPDGRKIAFIRRGLRDTTPESQIWIVDLETRAERKVAGEYDAFGGPTFLRDNRPLELAWSPDGERIGFLAQTAVIASVGAGGEDVPGFSTHVAGLGVTTDFDWTAAGFVTPCTRGSSNQPRILFCTYGSSGTLESVNGIGEEHIPANQGQLAGGTSWQPSGLNGRRVMVSVSYGAAPGEPPITNVFSVAPSRPGSSLAREVRQHTRYDGMVTCNPRTLGGSTYLERQTTILDPVPSPDGRDFVARRWESIPEPAGGCRQADHGLYVFRGDGTVQAVAALGISVEDAAWQPDSALRSAELLGQATLKVYARFSHGICTTHAEVIDRDLLAFVRG